MTDFVDLLKQAEEDVINAQRFLDQIQQPLELAKKLAPKLKEVSEALRKTRKHFFITMLNLQAAVVDDRHRAINVTGYKVTWSPGMFYLQVSKDTQQGFVNVHPDLFEYGSDFQGIFWEYCEKVVAQIESILKDSSTLCEAEKLKELISRLTTTF